MSLNSSSSRKQLQALVTLNGHFCIEVQEAMVVVHVIVNRARISFANYCHPAPIPSGTKLLQRRTMRGCGHTHLGFVKLCYLLMGGSILGIFWTGRL